MDGITGFDPDKSKSYINDFVDRYDQIAFEFGNALSNMLIELSTKWYSPRTTGFWNESRYRVSNIVNLFYSTRKTILVNVFASYNCLARANNYPTTEDYYSEKVRNIVSSELEELEFKEASDTGAVGMNTMLVKNVILPVFTKTIDVCYQSLDNLPMSIAFYDPEGEIQAKYKELISTLRENLKKEVEVVMRALTYAIEQEADNIEIAKQNATDALSVGA